MMQQASQPLQSWQSLSLHKLKDTYKRIRMKRMQSSLEGCIFDIQELKDVGIKVGMAF